MTSLYGASRASRALETLHASQDSSTISWGPAESSLAASDLRVTFWYGVNPPGALAMQVQGDATRDPEEPRRKATPRGVEGAGRTPHLQEHLLGQFLGQGPVAQHLQSYPEDRAAIPVVEPGDGGLYLRASEACHELLVR